VSQEITFANALLTDAIGKAARVAPTKGSAFDKAAGIVIEARPNERLAIIRSTDIDTTYRQEIEAIGGSGDPVNWRVSSALLDGILQGLGQGDNDTTTFIGRDDDKLRLTSGRTVTALQLLPYESFPKDIDQPTVDMISANSMATKVDQVAWAVDPKSNILSGVHMDGKQLIGTNQFSFAVVPCAIGIDEPITAPMEGLRSLIRSASDVSIAAEGQRLYIALDDETLTSTNLLQGDYPNLEGLMRSNFLGTMKIHRMSLIESLGRIAPVVRQERLPNLTVSLDASGFIKMILLDIEVPGVGRMRDEVTVETEYTGPFTLSFIPYMLEKAVDNAKGDYIFLDFGVADNPSKAHSIQIRDEKGYRCYVMPKVK
jgi:DNA polymerase III sliding clamp (beta) subunit (PCNA family)